MQNSLDARSTQIDLLVSLDRWTLRCSDNGTGIALSDLCNLAKERYWTSKEDPQAESSGETFGFRGEAMASMAEVGALEVESRREVDGETGRLIVRDGRRWFESSVKMGRDKPGTTVIVRDIFYKWPVRRRALSTASSRLTLLSNLRTAVSTLTLIHPHVSFTLTSHSDDEEIPRQLLNVAKSKEGVLGRWRQVWGRAGVEEVVEFHEVDEKGGGSRRWVFGRHKRALGGANSSFYDIETVLGEYSDVNSRPISPCALHKVINALFASSSFARRSSSALSSTQAEATHNTSAASRKSPKKSAERYPVFLVMLTVPREEVDVTLEPEKKVVEFRHEANVLAFIEKITKAFLLSQGYIPAPSAPSVTPTPAPSRLSTLTQFFSTSRPSSPAFQTPLKRSWSAPLPLPAVAAASESAPVITTTSFENATEEGDEGTVEPIQWTDPKTKRVYLLDPRTGNSVGESGKEWGGMVDRRKLRRTLGGDAEGENGEQDVPGWLVESLEGWENPIFASVDGSCVPSLLNNTTIQAAATPSTPTTSCRPCGSSFPSRLEMRTIDAFFRTSHCTPAHAHSISRDALQNIQFIAQFDRKFLLAVSKAAPSTPLNVLDTTLGKEKTLLLIDQHAASERVRVERYLRSLCDQPKVFEFDEAVPVLLTKGEVAVVKDQKGEFERWGLGLTVDPAAALAECAREKEGEGENIERDYVQIYVHSVPALVSGRLAADPRLLEELIKSHVAKLQEFGGGGTEEGEKEDVVIRERNGWVSTARLCPPVLLDLVYSKACRGAIMFNDVLTNEQAIKLLANLAETCFPFQCAHGRPSLVPLVHLPSLQPTKRGIDWSRLDEPSS